jgi:hypothetical protein
MESSEAIRWGRSTCANIPARQVSESPENIVVVLAFFCSRLQPRELEHLAFLTAF